MRPLVSGHAYRRRLAPTPFWLVDFQKPTARQQATHDTILNICYHRRMNPELAAALFVFIPLSLGILMLLIIWHARGRVH